MVKSDCPARDFNICLSTSQTLKAYSPFTIDHLLTVYLPEHDVERADDCDHVGDEVADAHLPERLKVYEARRTDAHAIRAARAVAHQITAYLALRAFD